jgi:anthranilate phosphoribosyltransferase
MADLPDPSPPLSAEQADLAFAQILDGACSDNAIASFLSSLADRGETATELAAAARAMRARMISINAPANAIDVCGTGGDGQHSLNVSTAVAIVVAACDVPVAKHGNRAASSKAGAADTLEALGVRLDISPDVAERQLADLGICFLFAQNHHPALKRLGPIRKAIGRRTIFNLLGPLANPAGVSRQLIGVAAPAIIPVYAQAMEMLNYERAMVVSGWDAEQPNNGYIDEISVAYGNASAFIGLPTSVLSLEASRMPCAYAPMSALRGGDPACNAAALRALLQGERSAYRDAVLLNAAGALIVAGVAQNWDEGVEEAAEAIDKGLANALLNCWIKWQ